MRKKIILIAGAFLLISLGVLIGNRVIAPRTMQEAAAINGYTPDRIQRIVDALILCESQGNPRAINPLDKDGTASWGILQFKPTSLRMYGIKYGYFGEKVSWDWVATKLFDGELQKQIARQMITDPTIDKYNEWPVCWPKVKNI